MKTTTDLFVEAALKSLFYQKKLQHVPDDWNQIPLTTKHDLRAADAYDLLGTTLDQVATYHETSGTTGLPTPSWYSFADVEEQARVIAESDLFLGPQDILLNRFPFALAIPSFILYWACQQVKAGHIATSKGTPITPPVRVIEILQRTKATVIGMLPSEAEVLAGAAEQMGVALPTPGLRALLVAGELMTPSRKQHLEQLWGVPVYGFFGSTETGGWYVACKEGQYHLNQPQAKIEVLDETGTPVGYGVRGDCVISTAREGMPLLRYANEDLIAIQECESCACGRTEPILLHYGRKADLIELPGKTLGFYDVQEAVYRLSSVPMLWRVHVYPERLEFEYQAYKHQERAGLQEEIAQELEALLGMPIRVFEGELVPADSLRTKPAYGKFAHFVRK